MEYWEQETVSAAVAHPEVVIVLVDRNEEVVKVTTS
jgi:hypothetical protein